VVVILEFAAPVPLPAKEYVMFAWLLRFVGIAVPFPYLNIVFKLLSIIIYAKGHTPVPTLPGKNAAKLKKAAQKCAASKKSFCFISDKKPPA